MNELTRRFFHYLHEPKLLSATAFLGAINGISGVLITLLIGRSVDQMVGPGKVDFQQITTYCFYLLGLIIVNALSQWFIQRNSNLIAYRASHRLRRDLFYKLDQLPIRTFDQFSHGNIASRFTNDADNVATACTAVFAQVFSGVATILFALGIMLYLNGWLTLVVLVSTPVIFIVNWLVARASQQNFRAQQQIVGDLSGFINEHVQQQKLVKAFQQEARVKQAFAETNQTLYVQGQKAQFASSLTNPLSRFVDHLTYLSLGLVGGLLIVAGWGQVTVGVLSAFLIYASQFSKPFIDLSGISTQIQTAFASLKRIFEILDEPDETPDAPDALVLSQPQGAVTFQQVYFAYQPTQPLIEDFSLQVAPGETVAIVGKTGAGKSTIVNLLMRFYDPDKGAILIDDVDSRRYTRDSLRQNFGMVLQDPWLFESTIRENLLFGRPDASEEELRAAARAAYIDDFIMKLPEGYDTVLGQSGLSLSEGQEQLLTIARTIISQPKLLILDEATSSVDTMTEQFIQKAFLNLMEGRTSFVIAHRLQTIRSAHKILVMEQGKIIEVGDHDTLIAKHGAYYQLYQAQFQH